WPRNKSADESVVSSRSSVVKIATTDYRLPTTDYRLPTILTPSPLRPYTPRSLFPLSMTDLVFFYGTLMSGFKRPGRNRVDAKLTPLGRGWIHAALFDLGI